ncbi:hypothetical protein [Anaerococcus lactolyticus]|uniref:Uncharacterized protein n=1 Tax=Anaerococcus lactolyticus S7-1-13 TaxID=1284686 RepID=A0A095YHQ2_9FIRM|nr:hypothetical protein [Anaerococcus lactolyticus]KGF06072.1 hypothetical protein HMPREF1630_00305 [Anaerococcus lactolyticus S7-1-13]
MKMNKLAAGALALALGLGAVAPAVASEHGTKLVEVNYNERLAEAQKYFAQREDARKKSAAAKERYEAAKKAQEKAEKKYKDLDEDKPGSESKTAKDIQDELDGPAGHPEQGLKAKAAKAIKDYADAQDGFKKGTKQQSDVDTAKKAYDEAVKKLDEALTKLGEAKRKEAENAPDLDKNKLGPKAQAFVDLDHANQELRLAYKAYGEALDKEAVLSQKFKDTMTDLNTAAELVNKIVTIEGTKIVVKDAKPAAKSVAEAVKALKASIDDNKAAVKSAEFLLQNAPKSVAKVKAKLEAQITKAKAAITKGEAALAKVEKKMAFIATAYAAEDDVKVEDLEALTKENKESASDINNTIKENEKEQPAVEEEKKPEEKKPEENKPARKAGKNAKTGIAGIAGVAGILAAASVAYAASKRD